MQELGGTIKFQLPGGLDLQQVEQVYKEIKALPGRERIPAEAKLTRLMCRVDGEVTRCSLKWTLESAPFVGMAVR